MVVLTNLLKTIANSVITFLDYIFPIDYGTKHGGGFGFGNSSDGVRFDQNANMHNPSKHYLGKWTGTPMLYNMNDDYHHWIKYPHGLIL